MSNSTSLVPVREVELVVVEDDAIYQAFYMDACPSGTHLSFTDTVSEAIHLCSLITPDAAIVDLSLPDGDGIEAIKQLKKLHSHKTLQILVITASTDEVKHQQAIDAGAIEVLTKPIAAAEVRSVINRIAKN